MNSNTLKTAFGVVLVLLGFSLVSKTLDLAIRKHTNPSMIEVIDNLPPYILRQDLNPKDGERFEPLVRLEDKETGFFCSGTVISDDYVLTASHCLTSHRLLKLQMRRTPFNVVSLDESKTTVEAIAAASNMRSDLGLVKGDFKQFKKLDISLTPMQSIQFSTMLMSCGFPWSASAICYPILSEPQIYYQFFAAKGLLYPGQSGGPVIDRITGTVIGVNSAVGDGFVVFSGLTGLFEQFSIRTVEENQ